MALPFWDYPPYPFLEHTLQYCPKAAHLYMRLWQTRGKENKIEVDKGKINRDYLMSVATFNHNLRLLCREALINVEEHPQSITIELVGWETECFDE